MGTELLGLLGARMLGEVLRWGTLGAVLLLVVGIVLSIALARTRALRVTFPGARWARGLTYAWIVLSCLGGGGTLGAVHGGVRALSSMLGEPDFAATALRPAAEPLTDGLIHAVALQAAIPPEPMLSGIRPIPVAVLRRILTDTTGAALLAGLRRVPALAQSETGQQGSVVAAALAGIAAKGEVEGAMDVAGLAAPMAGLAAALPEDPAATIDRAALVVHVERSLLPRFVGEWIARGETQALWSIALWLLLSVAAPIATLWLIEALVRLARSRRASTAPAVPAATVPGGGQDPAG